MKQEFNRAMDQVTLPEAEARIISVLEGKTAGSPPPPRTEVENRRRGRSRRDPDDRRSLCRRLSGGGAGPVFPGDTGSLEPYVQTTIPSAEHEGYRLTVDNSLYDGQNLYILMTVEALNQQAASELEHLRIASPHTICWALALPGSSDTAQITAHSMGVQELPARTDASRTWQVDLNFDGFMGKQDRPLLLWLDFMGEDHAVSIPSGHHAGTHPSHPKRAGDHRYHHRTAGHSQGIHPLRHLLLSGTPGRGASGHTPPKPTPFRSFCA